MNTFNTLFRNVSRLSAVACGLFVIGSMPAAAQFLPLRAWGASDAGQVGNGEPYSRFDMPQMVYLNSPVTQFSSGRQHSLAVKADGTVWAWGNNSSGQIGDPTLYDNTTPTQVPNFGNVRQVAAGGSTSLAIKNDGNVWAWGSNFYGDLGHGGFDNAKHPVPSVVIGLYNIKEVSANGHEMALSNDGYVYCWGFNLNGELGTGDTTNYAYPAQVFTINNVRHIAAGAYHSLALKNDGTVWAWGANDTGQLGDGTTTERHNPVQVIGLTNIVAIAASESCSIALKADGSVWYWGFFYGFSGSENRGIPRQMTELGYNNVQIALGKAHILTVDQDGYVWAIGDNEYGQIGDPRAGYYQYPARKLDNLYNVTAISVGYNTSIVQTNAAGISGNVRLEGLVAGPTEIVTLVFNTFGHDPITRTVHVTSDPFIQVDDLPRGYYSISIKGLKWLQRTIYVDLTYANSTSDLDVTLLAGDANNDNQVDIADFGVLVNAYGSSSAVTGSGYDYLADLNDDGSVDIGDFGLLVNNYGLQGDR